jgi:acetyl-CoA carboxylase carboxyltransferase component
VSGVSDYLARDEHDALRLGREIIGMLNARKAGPGPRFDA